MKKIAVVTAPNMRFVNTGMITVELAALNFLKKIYNDACIKFYTIVPPNPEGNKKWMMMDLGYVHTSVSSIENLIQHIPLFENIDDFLSNDIIIYWGDFIQAKHYLKSEAAGRLSEIYGINNNEAIEFSYRALLQANMPDYIKKRSIVFGSSLLYNTAQDYTCDQYGKYIVEFFKNCRGVFLRDPISATRASHLKKEYGVSCLGIDPAFLLHAEDFDNFPKTEWSMNLPDKNKIGLFFGTRTEPPKRLLNFCESIAKHFNADIEWLPWFPYHEILKYDNNYSILSKSDRNKSYWKRKIEELMPRGDNYNVWDIISAIPKYKFIITDTYHLCINAWRYGVPAICFGTELNTSSKVIKDFKKRILFEMYDASNFYFDTSSLNTSISTKITINLFCKLLDDNQQIDVISNNIKSHSIGAGNILEKTINQIE